MFVPSIIRWLIQVPPPSSDRRKWWLDHDASSKVEIPKPPGEGWQLNPNRPKNPFDPTNEPDWIKVTSPQLPVSLPSVKKVPPLPPPRRQQSDRTPSSPQEPIGRRLSSASLDGRSKPPVPPKPIHISTRKSIVSASPPPMDDEDFKPKPPLPPRTQEVSPQHVVKNGEVGLLMDDDETGGRVVGGWVPLQPSKEL